MPDEKKPLPIDRFSYNDDETKTLIVEKATDENKTDNNEKKEDEK